MCMTCSATGRRKGESYESYQLKKNRHSHTDNGDADHAGADGKRIG